MFRIASCIALSLLLAPARGAETADPAQALLEQARQWQFLERPLDGQHALDQLLRIAQPASNLHAEALTLQALGQLQSRQTEQARRTLARLRAQHPGYAGIARVERMFRLRGADSAALLRARALFQAGRAQEAYAAFDKLYQGSPPEGPLALEYWQVVARLPGDGWSRAQTELKRLRAAHPTSHRVRAVLASIYLLHPPLPQAVLDELQRFGQTTPEHVPSPVTTHECPMQTSVSSLTPRRKNVSYDTGFCRCYQPDCFAESAIKRWTDARCHWNVA